MSNYNLENIFVRFEQSPITDLQSWLSNNGKRPYNNDMFDTLNGIKNIREDTKEADTFKKIDSLNQDLDLIENPSEEFTNLDKLKGTSRDELDQQYNNVLITVKADIKLADTTEDLKEIVPRFEGAELKDKRQLGRARAFRNRNIVFEKPFDEVTREDLETTRQFTDLQLTSTWGVSLEEAQAKKREVGL